MVNDLISRKALIGKDGLFAQRRCPGNCQYCNLWTEDGCRVILEAPTVDAVEVVHGEWRDGCTVYDGKVISHSIDCSVCQGVFKASRREVTQHWKEQFKICPFCGAVMDGGNKYE